MLCQYVGTVWHTKPVSRSSTYSVEPLWNRVNCGGDAGETVRESVGGFGVGTGVSTEARLFPYVEVVGLVEESLDAEVVDIAQAKHSNLVSLQ